MPPVAVDPKIVAQRKALLKLWLTLTTGTTIFDGININDDDSEEQIKANAAIVRNNIGDIPNLPDSASKLVKSAVSPGYNDIFVQLQARYQDVSTGGDFWPIIQGQPDPDGPDHPTKAELADFFTV